MVARNFVVLTDVFGRREYMSITRRSFGGLMGASFGMVALRGFALSKDSNAYVTHGVASGALARKSPREKLPNQRAAPCLILDR